MSGQHNGDTDEQVGIRIDAKFLGVLTFLIGQMGVAIWWASEKSAEITHLQSDMAKLSEHFDKQLDRMENKIDALSARQR